MSTPFAKRAGGIVAVLALSALAAVGTALPAHAEPGNIDPTIPRSLTIHKYELSPTSPQNRGTGQEIPGGIPGGVPIEGVEFTATLVPSVNLLTEAGWAAASSLTPATATSLATGASFTGTTNAAGVATFGSTLPIGLYLVTETGVPDEVTNPTAPFLVTLPFPTGAGGSPANDWIYDVHVYPKNSVTELIKTRVVPPAGSVEARSGDLVRWAIRASIPTLAGDPLNQFVLTDQLSPGLEFVATPPTGVQPTQVTVANAAGLQQTFTLGNDYSLVTAGDTLTLTFTPTGRTRLATLGGGTVTLSVLTRAVSTPPDGRLLNTATSAINDASETVTAVTPIGQITVLSYAPQSNGDKVPLAGAKYTVYLTEADARAGTNPVSFGGVSSFTSDEDGLIFVPAAIPAVYWTATEAAPAGYLVPLPLYNPGEIVQGPTNTALFVNYFEVPFSQVPAWALPLTGGSGALWFGLGGAALVAVAVGAAIIVARRRRATVTRAAE